MKQTYAAFPRFSFITGLLEVEQFWPILLLCAAVKISEIFTEYGSSTLLQFHFYSTEARPSPHELKTVQIYFF